MRGDCAVAIIANERVKQRLDQTDAFALFESNPVIDLSDAAYTRTAGVTRNAAITTHCDGSGQNIMGPDLKVDNFTESISAVFRMSNPFGLYLESGFYFILAKIVTKKSLGRGVHAAELRVDALKISMG